MFLLKKAQTLHRDASATKVMLHSGARRHLFSAATMAFVWFFGIYCTAADIQFTVTWSNPTDIDLHVVDPAGEEIFYLHPSSASGGVYSGDDQTGTGPEYITWNANAPLGMYRFWAVNFTGTTAVTWTLTLAVNGAVKQVQTGSLPATARASSVLYTYQHGWNPEGGDVPVAEPDCCGTGGSSAPNISADPVQYATGEIILKNDDLASDGFSPWVLRRVYANRRPDNAIMPFGVGWNVESMPKLVPDGNDITFVSGTSALVFIGTGFPITYAAQRSNQEKLAVYPNVGGASGFIFTDTGGGKLIFYGVNQNQWPYLQGKLYSSVDAAGNGSQYEYDNLGRLTTVRRSGKYQGSPAQEEIYFFYHPTNYLPGIGLPFGTVGQVTRNIWLANGTRITPRLATYDYYGGAAGEFGEAGQLKLVQAKTYNPGFPDPVLARYHYRYWRAGETQPNGIPAIANLLKYVISGASYERMALTIDPQTAPHTTLATYAEKYFEYDALGRVTKQVLRGPEIDGTGTQTYQYTTSTNPDALNAWRTKTIETLADGLTQTIVYSNRAGAALVKIIKEGVAPNRQWIEAFRYDTSGRETWHAMPSAFEATYSPVALEATDAYLGLGSGSNGNASTYVKASDGLILERSYYTSTTATATVAGGVSGYLFQEASRKGRTGALEPTRSMTYFTRTGN